MGSESLPRSENGSLLEAPPLVLERVDPSLLNESLDFFLRDFLGISGRPDPDEPAASFASLFRREDLVLPSDESLDLLDCLDFSFFLGESAFSVEELRLEDFGKSGRSLRGEVGGLLLLFESSETHLISGSSLASTGGPKGAD